MQTISDSVNNFTPVGYAIDVLHLEYIDQGIDFMKTGSHSFVTFHVFVT